MRSYNRKTSHSVHDLKVNLVWITKYRYKVLNPKISVSEMVRFFKGCSSRKIQEEFLQLSKKYWGKHFWGVGCAAFSSGHVTDEMIQHYLENHENDPNHNDDDFKVE